MSTLTKTELRRRISLPTGDNEKLTITPLLTQEQIGDCSIDVRLGNQFIVFRMHRFGSYDPYDTNSTTDLHCLQERQIVAYGESFMLHPGNLALTSTLEYVAMPNDLECRVDGRSSWARLGLQVATANVVEPGFRGVVTLEVSNVGTIPLKLIPGVRIAQFVFQHATPPTEPADPYSRKYACPVGPEFSRIHRDTDASLFRQKFG